MPLFSYALAFGPKPSWYRSRMSSLTSDQAAFMLHVLGLPALKAEHSMTTAVIAAIPPKRAGYRPHHRGQLSTYLRPMGAKVQSLYGPSYDAGGFTGGARGGRTLWLGVWERNARAKAFYGKNGFVDVGSHVFMVGTDAQTDRILVRQL